MSKDDDWIENLIKLGIGALAVFFLVKLLTQDQERSGQVSRCPYCGSPIKKWALECPRCRKRLPSRTPFI